MMTKLEKRIIASILSAMMCLSAVQFPVLNVHAEEIAAEGTQEESNDTVPEVAAQDIGEEEAKFIPIPENIVVEEAESNVAELEESTEQDITQGNYETEVSEESPEHLYRFVAEKAGVYCIRMKGQGSGYVETLERREYLGDGIQLFVNLEIGEECFISIGYSDQPGIASWSIMEAEIPVICEGEKREEVVDFEGWDPVYKFVPEKSGTYAVCASNSLYTVFHDSDWEWLGSDRMDFEAGQTYYLELRYYFTDLEWSIDKVNEIEIQEGEVYTKTAGQTVDYRFVPDESGRYQFDFDVSTRFEVYDENRLYVSDGYGTTGKVELEKDQTYYINIVSDEEVNWSVSNVEIIEIQENTEYTTTAGQIVEYQFTPLESGVYQFDFDEYAYVTVYDSDNRYIDSGTGFSKQITLEKDVTYYIDIKAVFDGVNSIKWDVGKTEMIDIQVDTEYTTTVNQKVYYQYSPMESGKYQLNSYRDVRFEIYNENWESVYSGMDGQFMLEQGVTYYIVLDVKQTIKWNIAKVETIEVQLNTEYEVNPVRAVSYQFTPSKSEVYQFYFDKEISVRVENEEGFWDRWYGFEKAVFLEEGQTYYMCFDTDKTVKWSVEEAELINVKEKEVYNVGMQREISYLFIPEKSGEYQISFDTGASFSVYDEVWNYIMGAGEWSDSGFNSNLDLEAGHTYYISIDSDDAVNWNIANLERQKIQVDTEYTIGAGEAKDYQFIPLESGRYQFCFDKDTQFGVYNEQGEYVSSGKGSHKKVLLTKGKTYYVHFFNYSEVNWKVVKAEIQEIQEAAEYTTTKEQAVDYQFVPQQTGTYILFFERMGECTIYDSNWNSIGNQGYLSRNDIKVSLIAGETYYFDLMPSGESVDWKLESVKVSNEYVYRIQEDDTVQIIDYLGEQNTISIPATIAGKNVTSIGGGAFGSNQLVEDIMLPASVTEIQYESFIGCTSLRQIKFASGSQLKAIEDTAFAGCTKLSDMILPDGVQKLGEEVFKSTGLTEINIPDSVTEIGEWTFSFCNSLQSVSIGAGLNEISEALFADCENIQKVEFSQGSQVKKIGQAAFNGCKKLTSIIIPESVQELGDSVFGNSGLVEIDIPDSVTKIGMAVFSYCKSLQKVNLGSGLAEISEFMFSGCEQLSQVNFSGVAGSVTKIEYGAFVGCDSLQNIEIPDSVKSMNGVSMGGAFTNMEAALWYENQPEGVMYIDNVLYGYKGRVEDGTNITIEPGTTVIASHAFYLQSGLTGVELPNGVTNIGKFAFFDCENMKEVTIPRSVTEIEPLAFGYVGGTPVNGSYYDQGDSGCGFAQKVEGFTIYGYPNSAAQKYADENGFEFVSNVSYIKGDVNEDGSIDSADLRLVLRAVCGKTELTAEQQLAADVEGDGNEVDSQDMRKILQFICGKIEEL